jgi:ribosomal protein S27AE
MKTLPTRKVQFDENSKYHLAIVQSSEIKVQETAQTIKIERVHCPNCGSFAERHHFLESHVTRTQCGSCDYLMVMSPKSGRVIEAYAPGISTLPNFCSLAHAL